MSLSSSVLVALTFAGDVSRSGSASVVAGGSRGAVDPADESARGEAAWRESEGRCERLPARVIGPCVGAPAPEEEAFAFNANEAASSPDPLAVVSTDAGNGSGSGPDQTSPAKVSAGSMGLPKTLTLAGKVSRWRELAVVVDRRAGLPIHVRRRKRRQSGRLAHRARPRQRAGGPYGGHLTVSFFRVI